MRLSELEAVVESLLFIAGDAVPLASIAQTIELDQATTRAVVLSLAASAFDVADSVGRVGDDCIAHHIRQHVQTVSIVEGDAIELPHNKTLERTAMSAGSVLVAIGCRGRAHVSLSAFRSSSTVVIE